MATPGTTTRPKARHNLTISDHAWRAIQVRAVELGIPAGEVIDRAIGLVERLTVDERLGRPLLRRAQLTPNESTS